MKFTSRFWLLLGVGVLGITVLVAYLVSTFPEALTGRDGQINLTRSLIILGFVGASVILRGRLPVGHAFRYALIWIALGGLLVLGYGFRHEAKSLSARFLAELLPHRAQSVEGGVSVATAAYGQFVVQAQVNGTDIRFLVDTGASDVVLSPADAKRLGYEMDKLRFTQTYQTANGLVQGAPVRLAEIAIGPITVKDVRASVNGAEMRRSLLGMSFLGRLSGYEVRAGRLILKP